MLSSWTLNISSAEQISCDRIEIHIWQFMLTTYIKVKPSLSCGRVGYGNITLNRTDITYTHIYKMVFFVYMTIKFMNKSWWITCNKNFIKILTFYVVLFFFFSFTSIYIVLIYSKNYLLVFAHRCTLKRKRVTKQFTNLGRILVTRYRRQVRKSRKSFGEAGTLKFSFQKVSRWFVISTRKERFSIKTMFFV